MDDSPLSFVANITGILTFIAAILAFIYARYRIIQNGHAEIEDIFGSVSTSMEDRMAVLRILELANRDKIRDTARLKQILTNMYTIELDLHIHRAEIYAHYCLRPPIESVFESQFINDSMARRIQDLEKNRSPQPSATILRCLQLPSRSSMMLDALRDIGNLLRQTVGTADLLRWYRVRQVVLEKLRRREVLLSRLSLEQIYMTYSSAQNQEASLQALTVAPTMESRERKSGTSGTRDPQE